MVDGLARASLAFDIEEDSDCPLANSAFHVDLDCISKVSTAPLRAGTATPNLTLYSFNFETRTAISLFLCCNSNIILSSSADDAESTNLSTVFSTGIDSFLNFVAAVAESDCACLS